MLKSIRGHVSAIVYVAAAGVLVTRLAATIDPSTYFGSFYPVLVRYPVAFWALTLAFTALATSGGRRNQRALATAVGLGLLVHLNFLAISLLADGATIAKLAVPYFMYYARGVLLVIVIAANAIGCWHARRAAQGLTPPAWLAAAYLPAASLAFGPIQWIAPAVIASAALAFAAPRLYQSASGHRLWPAVRSFVSDPRVFAAALLLLALAMRLTAALRLAGMGFETVNVNSDDASQYDANARGLLSGFGVSADVDTPTLSNYSPGYSLFLAVLYGVTDRDLTWVLVAQAIISSFVPVALYLVGRRSYGETAGRIAGVIAALSQLLIFNSVNLTREMISLALVLPMIAMLQRSGPHASRGHLARVAAGVLLGLLILVDPVFIFVALAFSVASVLSTRRPSVRRLLPAATVWLALYATVVPLKHLVVSPASFGERLSLVTRPSSYSIHVSKDFNPYALELYERGINPFAYPVGSLKSAAVQPIDTLRLEASKMWLDFRRFFFEGNSGYFFPLLLVANSDFSAHIFFYAVLAAMIGLGAAVRRIRRSPGDAWQAGIPLLAMVAYSATYIVLFFGMTRFRATVHPILLLWIGCGLAATLSWLRVALDGAPHGVRVAPSLERPLGSVAPAAALPMV